tara:strand:+ start:101 stop:499 length:399 start_codon:yes stop_codon:yes gene_type:complete
MAIKATLSADEFVMQFRQIRNDNFSVSALYALFEYFENLSEEMGEDIEFDPIANCCEYSEYHSVKELFEDYPQIVTPIQVSRASTPLDDIPLRAILDILRYRGVDPIAVEHYDGTISSIVIDDSAIAGSGQF